MRMESIDVKTQEFNAICERKQMMLNQRVEYHIRMKSTDVKT